MCRKIYFDREGLVDSGAVWTEEGMPYRLFISISSVYPFVKFEEELQEINDYCLFILCRLEEKLTGLARESTFPVQIVRGYGEEKGNREGTGNAEYQEDALEMLEDLTDPLTVFSPIYTWEKLSQDINKCTMLLLLLSYLESSLNELTKWFCGERSVPLGHKARGQSEVEFYLAKIDECLGGRTADALGRELAYLGMVRSIRNQFVHREWDQIERHYAKFRLCDVFDAISSVLAEIEKAACRSGLIEKQNKCSKNSCHSGKDLI